MKLWMLKQTDNTGYDTFDSAIVAAEDSDSARKIHPSEHGWDTWTNSWAISWEKVTATYIGEAAVGIEAGVILGSFNAG